jgi:hypothetical protein
MLGAYADFERRRKLSGEGGQVMAKRRLGKSYDFRAGIPARFEGLFRKMDRSQELVSKNVLFSTRIAAEAVPLKEPNNFAPVVTCNASQV